MRQPVPAAVLALALALAGTGTAAAAPDSTAARAGAATFFVQLDGDAVPAGGDPAGGGIARVRLDPRAETVCLDMTWKRLAGRVTAMHIHMGEDGRTGEHHIDLFDGVSFPGKRNVLKTCVQVQGHEGHTPGELIKGVIKDPDGFYLNVHSTRHAKGAIRGQIG